VTVGRRAAIGILIVALVVLGVLLVVHAKKKPSQAAPPNPTVLSHPSGKLTPLQRTIIEALGNVAAESQVTLKATYKVTYSSFDVPGSPSKVFVEEMPPDRLFKARTSEVIIKNKKTYYCVTSGAVSCRVTKSAAATPLGRLMAVYDPATYVATIHTVRTLIRSGAAYRFSSSHKLVANLPSDCVSWSYRYSSVNYCVTKTGVLTYFTISGVAPSGAPSALTLSIRLNSYSSKSSLADFALPKAAKLLARAETSGTKPTLSHPGKKATKGSRQV